LVDAGLVAPAGEFGAKEGVHAGLGHVRANQPRAQRQHIGIIMLARQRRRKRVVYPCAAACRVAIDRDGDADARAANDDAAVGVSA